MAYSFLVFDFGSNEDLAQEARQRIDRWRQGFRLDKKLQLKFDRNEQEPTSDGSSDTPKASKTKSKTKSQTKTKSKSGEEAGKDSDSNAPSAEIRMIVRLDFSDHEKLSHQRWLERIPGEEPFKSAKPQIVRAGEPQFESTAEKFDSLD
jgi:hypothetical protein